MSDSPVSKSKITWGELQPVLSESRDLALIRAGLEKAAKRAERFGKLEIASAIRALDERGILKGMKDE